MITIIVSGLIPYDSGKTWFTISTGLALKRKGYNVGIFKPVAGHNIWYSPRTYLKSIELGVLVGNDILAYYEYNLVDSILASNPIAIATLPPDPTKFTKIDEYFEIFETTSNVAVLTRVYNCESKLVDHYVHLENMEKMSDTCKRVIARLQSKLSAKSKPFSNIAEYLTSLRVERDLDYCLGIVSRGKDYVFVEGFNDTVTPYFKILERADVLVIVAPGKVLVYEDVNRVKDLVKKVSSGLGYEGFRARYVVNELRPSYAFETGLSLKPLPRKAHLEFIEILLEKTIR